VITVERIKALSIAGWRAVRAIPPLAPLVLAALFAIAYGFPGYMNYDSAEQLSQARNRIYDDWHPPMMARYWHVLEQVFRGPTPLLVLQIALFLWGLYGILQRRFRPGTSALMSCALLLFPPVLVVMAVVWKDAQMVGWLVAGAMLMARTTTRARIAGALLVFLAAAVRDNACTALPPLLLVIVASWGFRRKLVIIGVAVAAFVAIVGAAFYANAKLADGQSHAWAKANAIHDIAGTICYADPMFDEQVREELAGIPLRQSDGLQGRFCAQYMPRWWFPLSFNPRGLFSTTPDAADVAARRDAYFRVIRNHPGAFLTHRWNVTRELLGLGEVVPDEPVCQTFAGTPEQQHALMLDAKLSFLQRVYGRKFVRYSHDLLFRPWAYLLVGLILFAYAAIKRDALVMAILGSGFMYEASFMVAAAGAPFRYSQYMILCVSLATLIIFGDRLRQGRDEVRGRAPP
jgi:hypothetical protein